VPTLGDFPRLVAQLDPEKNGPQFEEVAGDLGEG
jgi:hypothetical protein